MPETKRNPDIKISNLRCEYLTDPLGIDEIKPKLSWVLESAERGQEQTAYQILVAGSREELDRDEGGLWDSGKVDSAQSAHVEYKGKKLESRQGCRWKVRVWDKNGKVSAWSPPAMWSMGLLEKKDWAGAKFVGADWEGDPAPPLPWICKDVVLESKPKQAMAYVCALGYYELYINGKKVDDHVLSPAVSDYSKRTYYITHDVAKYLRKGKNCIGFWLGRGWYVKKNPGVIHSGPIVKGLIDAEHKEIVTDESFKVHPSPIKPLGRGTPSGDYGGEHYDARLEMADWNSPELDRSGWENAKAFETPDALMDAQKVQPNRVKETIIPVGVEEISPGEYMVDMGRNFTGWFEMKFTGENESGREIKFEYGDLRKDVSQLQSYNQRDIYIMKGKADEEFRTRFNYHAFRWVKINGLSRKPSLDQIKGHMIHTDYPSPSEFECSNDVLNRVYKTVVWTYKCLTLGGYIVDCPHRERLGYGGDAGTSFETGMFNFDVSGFYTKWMANWYDSQCETGDLPHTAPVYPNTAGGGPMWSGICITLPWQIYLHYGDKRILKRSYPTIKRWLSFVDTKMVDGIMEHFINCGIDNPVWSFLGDWARAHGGDRADENTNKFINNCFHLYELEISRKIARLLRKDEDAASYKAKAAELRKLLHERFFNPADGTYANGEQPYQALALLLDIVPADQRDKAMEKLEELIMVKNKGHLNAGMHGLYFMLKYLMNEYRDDLIFEMTSKKTHPSWGYMLEQGATTIWEYWEGQHSRIHDTLISIGSWFIQGVAGIRIDEKSPGFEHFLIHPAVVGDLTFARADFSSAHGKIAVDWKLKDGDFMMDVVIPANTTATVYLPAKNPLNVTEGGVAADKAEGIQFVEFDNDMAVYLVGSGKYRFASKNAR